MKPFESVQILENAAKYPRKVLSPKTSVEPAKWSKITATIEIYAWIGVL
jgi:hypothetical protein